MPRFRLSPYCVFVPDSNGAGVTLIHSLYGSKFSLSAEMFQILSAFLPGRDGDVEDRSSRSSSAISHLIEEKVLIRETEFLQLGGDKLFKNRLSSLELAFQREFNEGGYDPDLAEGSQAPPAMKRMKGLRSIALRQHADLPRCDLVECLETRRSLRSYGPQSLEKNTFERFLQLTAKAHALVRTRAFGTISLRNYPSGGARYPLEIYPLVNNVRSIGKGIYYYHPFEHRLELLSQDHRYRAALSKFAMQRMAVDVTKSRKPAVLFLVTAVFGRTAWKYKGIPLHLILTEVGALYQTMYLAATALKLAACPVGAFPERAVAEILKLDGRDESQVGMFALGAPDESPMAGIEDLAIHPGSPFSRETGARSIELVFSDGQREVIDLSELRFKRSPDGVLLCRVLRGRYWAELEEAARRKLIRMVKGKRADPDLSARFGHLVN